MEGLTFRRGKISLLTVIGPWLALYVIVVVVSVLAVAIAGHSL
jgi:hypothetical protein